MTVSKKYYCCLPLCLESANMATRRSSKLQRDYCHQQPSRPSPSTLRLLCGRLCHLYFIKQRSWAATFTGHKQCGEKCRSLSSEDDSTNKYIRHTENIKSTTKHSQPSSTFGMNILLEIKQQISY